MFCEAYTPDRASDSVADVMLSSPLCSNMSLAVRVSSAPWVSAICEMLTHAHHSTGTSNGFKDDVVQHVNQRLRTFHVEGSLQHLVPAQCIALC